MVEQRGIEPFAASASNDAKPPQKGADSLQFSALAQSAHDTNQQKSALSEQNLSTSEHETIVPSVHQDPDLAEVIKAWSELSDKAKARVLKIVKESR